jgi:hypothetical protein
MGAFGRIVSGRKFVFLHFFPTLSEVNLFVMLPLNGNLPLDCNLKYSIRIWNTRIFKTFPHWQEKNFSFA